MLAMNNLVQMMHTLNGMYFSTVLGEDDVQVLHEFLKKLSEFQKLLRCSVCDKLLTNKEVIAPKCLVHFACKDCKGKERQKDKQCAQCGDWENFKKNEVLDATLEAYQSMCAYLMHNTRFCQLFDKLDETVEGFERIKYKNLIEEGGDECEMPKVHKLEPVVKVEEQKSEPVSFLPAPLPDPTLLPATTTTPTPTPAKRTNSKKASVCSDKDEGANNGVKVSEVNISKTPPPTQLPSVPLSTSAPAVLVFRKLDETPNPKRLRGPNQTDPTGKKNFVVITQPEKFTARTPLTCAPTTFPSPATTPPRTISSSSSTVSHKLSSTRSPAPSSTITKKTPGSSASTVRAQQPVVIKVEAQPDTSPSKSTEDEDTYILGLSSPPHSPVKPVTTNTSPCRTPTTASSMPFTPVSSVVASAIPYQSLFGGGARLLNSQLAGNTIQLIQNGPRGPFVISSPIRIATATGSQGPLRIVGPAQTAVLSSRLMCPTGNSPRILNATLQKPGMNPVIVSSSGLSTSTGPTVIGAINPNSSGPRRKIILTSATPDFQNPQLSANDINQIIQLQSTDLSGISALRPNTFTMAAPSSFQARSRHSVTVSNQNLTVTSSGLLVRPTSTSVNTSTPTNLGGRPPSNPPTMSKVSMSPTPNVQFVRTSSVAGSGGGPVILRASEGIPSQQSAIPSQVPESTATQTSTSNNPTPSSSSAAATSKRKQEGCRCGNAAPTPGKLTCIGQRCACYVERTACSNCKCKGCKNPYVPGGQKWIRTLVDPQTNQTIPLLAAPMSSIGGGSPGSAAFTSSAPNSGLIAAIGSPSNFSTMQGSGVPSSVQTSGPIQIIPIRYGAQGSNFAPQYIQLATTQALQQLPLIFSSGNAQIQTGAGSGITLQSLTMPGGLSSAASTGMPQAVATQLQQQRPLTISTSTSGTIKIEKGD